ncbi:MAG: MarR family winged helix-turn-helix transcriptional regulator [Rhizobiaceae bacterium]
MKQDKIKKDVLTEELSNRLFFRLYQCANMLHKTGTKAVERHGITTQQWGILGALSDNRLQDGIPVGVLATRLMVSRQNLMGLLSRLEALDMVARVVDERDNRSRLIRLTGHGRKTWKAMQGDIASYYAAALRGFSSSDLIHTLHYLDTLRDNFRTIDTIQGGQSEG